MKLETYMAEHKIKHNALAKFIKRTRQTVHNLIAKKCVVKLGVILEPAPKEWIVIDDKIYKPVYDLEQLAESKEK